MKPALQRRGGQGRGSERPRGLNSGGAGSRRGARPPGWSPGRPPSRDPGRRARGQRASAASGGNMASEADLRAHCSARQPGAPPALLRRAGAGARAALLAQLEALEPEALRQHCHARLPPARAPRPAVRPGCAPAAPASLSAWAARRRVTPRPGGSGRRKVGGGGPGGGRGGRPEGATPTERAERGARGSGAWSSVCLLREIACPLTRTGAGWF